MTIDIWNASLWGQCEDSEGSRCTSYSQEPHEPGHKAVTGPVEDFQEPSKEWGSDGHTDEPTLDRVRDEQGGRRLVESMCLLEHKGLVDTQGQRRDGRREVEKANEENGLSGLRRRGQTAYTLRCQSTRTSSPYPSLNTRDPAVDHAHG
jgi:hypothetical protein